MLHGKADMLRGKRGFSLIELAIVISIISILYVTAFPLGQESIKATKEAVLKNNIKVLRECIDDYFADFGEYPASLDVLVEKKYIRAVPVDPYTKRSDTWVTEPSDPAKMDIYDVKSGSGENIENETNLRR
jgi:general secretion pathway protein G